MSMPESSSPTTPLLSKVKMSQPVRQSSRRIDQCTHGQVTRFWDKYDCFKCTVCQRPSHFGYLYRCTWDTHGNLPSSDFIDVEDELRDLEISSRPSTDSRSSLTPSSLAPSFPSFPTATSISTNASLAPACPALFTFDGIVEKGTKFVCRFKGPGAELEPESESESPRRLIVKNPEPPSTCDFKVCPACRPVYRDRAWQSINTILNGLPRLPSQFEMDNRPTSDSQALSNMRYDRQRFYANIPGISIGQARDPSVDTQDGGTRVNELLGRSGGDSKLEEKINGTGASKKKEHPLKQDSNASTPSVQTSDYDADTEQPEGSESGSAAKADPLAKSKRSSFLRNVVQNTSSRLNPHGQDSLPKMDREPREATSTSDHENNKERRSGRRLTKGRFFID